MNIVEQNRNQYTKERDDVEVYLTRIIQRFFDIKNNETQESVEAIINESLTRLKRDFYHLKTLIFHFNEQTGHIRVDISTVNGKLAFEKNTAFNKDFGDIQDTICEGNDLRLSDDREPIQHVHTIADIDALALISNAGSLVDTAHSHLNQNAMDVIRYTGSAVNIDLIIIERALEDLEGYAETIRRDKVNLESDRSTNLKPLTDLLDKVKANLKAAESLALAADSWLDYAKTNIDSKAVQLNNYLHDFLLDTEQAKYEAANEAVYLLCQDIIDLSDMSVFNNTKHSYNSTGIDTNVNYKASMPVSLSIPSGHKIAYIKVYIEFDKLESYVGVDDNGNISNLSRTTRRLSPLPMYYPNVKQNEPFVFTYEYTENGDFKVNLDFFVSIPSDCLELCKVGNTVVFCTGGMSIQSEIEKKLGYVLSYLNINGLSPANRNAVLNALDNLPVRQYEYLIDGRYKYVYDEDGNVIDEGWFDSKGDAITDIDWDVGMYDERPGAQLMLNGNNKTISVYVNNNNVERNALLSISPSALSGYIKNPKIRYQVYCRKG